MLLIASAYLASAFTHLKATCMPIVKMTLGFGQDDIVFKLG